MKDPDLITAIIVYLLLFFSLFFFLPPFSSRENKGKGREGLFFLSITLVRFLNKSMFNDQIKLQILNVSMIFFFALVVIDATVVIYLSFSMLLSNG